MPSLQKAKDLAKDLVCSTNQRNIAQALHMYARDHDGQIPYTNMYRPGWWFLSWCKRVGRITDNKRFMPMPFAAIKSINKICTISYVDFNWDNYREGTFKCTVIWVQIDIKHPDDRVLRDCWGHQYSINGLLSWDISWNRNRVLRVGKTDEGFMKCRRFGDIRKPKTVLIGDASITSLPQGTWPAYNHMPDIVRNPFDTRRVPTDFEYRQRDLEMRGPWPYTSWYPPARRMTRCNFYGHSGEKTILTFIDAHVESIRDLKPRLWSIE